MNILLWALQILAAVFCIAGAVYRFFNYELLAKGSASIQSLSYGTWVVIGLIEIVLALGLIVPPLFGMKSTLVPIAAVLLAVELLLVTGLHAKYFGLQFQATNPAIWTLGLAIVAAFIAYGRFAVKPL